MISRKRFRSQRKSRIKRRRRICATLLMVAVMMAGGAYTILRAQTTTLTPAELRARAKARTDSLKTVVLPDTPAFASFVVNRSALQVLGKALFWDEQVGSDLQACASCHFHAGADNRSKNQLNPGFRGNDNTFGNTSLVGVPSPLQFGPNYQLVSTDFPLHRLFDPNDTSHINDANHVASDTNDVASSMGVFNAQFNATGIPRDSGTALLTGNGAVFNVNGVLVRNVEPRNTPTTINAVFNRRNFWDGRARFEFNGVNPFGALDPNAMVVKSPAGPNATTVTVDSFTNNPPVFTQIRATFMSAASQADGPPLSDLEMSFFGRLFPQLGRKMLSANLTALGQQLVATDDSILGPYSNQKTPAGARGISARYADLIKQAFSPTWWNAPGWVVDISGSTPVILQGTPTATRFTVMEFNFSLFFGFAINEYERLLISDQTPFDTFMEGSDTALASNEQNGLNVFLTKGLCINCHSKPLLSNATIPNVQNFEILERMIMGNNEVAVYDNGFYNTAVRLTQEDIGVGGTAPSGQPLSDSRFFQQCVQAKVAAGATVRAANDQCQVPRILARPEEASPLLSKAAALLPAGDPSRTKAENLIAQANAALAANPPKETLASCLLAKNPALACPTHTVTNPDGTTSTVQNDGAWDVLAAITTPPPGMSALLTASKTLLPDTVSPGTEPQLLGPPLQPNERVAVDGAFKTSGLRNVELTAPFFHNGDSLSLEQVVDF